MKAMFWGDKKADMKVRCRPLGKLAREIGVEHVDFWSLDVEGAELTVLEVHLCTHAHAYTLHTRVRVRACACMLQTWDWAIPVDVLLVELDGRNAKKDGDVRALLRRRGMRFVACIDQNEIWERDGPCAHTSKHARPATCAPGRVHACSHTRTHARTCRLPRGTDNT